MTQDEIIEMAKEIAVHYGKAERFQTWTHDFMMQRLMELVTVSAATEREACAQLLESRKTGANELMDAVRDMEARAIRARGQA